MSTAVTSGSWPSVTADASTFSGLGTDHVRWGNVADDAKSGYVFSGGSVPVKLDGTEFTLGTFTHRNFPVPALPQPQFDVDLSVKVVFEDGTESAFSFRFHHNETPNDGPAPEDLVDLPSFVSPEEVTVDGRKYKVVISGFKQNGQIVRQFVSAEGGANSADVVALFAPAGEPDVVLTDVRFRGTAKNQADEYVEIMNRGSEPADISGWQLGADDAGQDFVFPAGTVIQPGQRIRVYTNEVHPEWGGHSYGINRPIWNNKGDNALLQNTAGKTVSEFPYGDKVKVAAP
ncbi:lamin tail domain-containing protein [Streptomyces sp. RFCAC02]|uniref:lamin tail domain-containing protein n=1 Tax=Streptomyces sp. RFCAC02 TaxID=2499143 RepID=UPI00101EB528|nr:lamin tail domain-containing protein [Streptomyces sp. RFCAC02]